jgi:uncharacterized membrane protein YfhO
MEFYPSVGIKRDVSSKPETIYRELRDLLSVRWLFIAQNNGEQEPMEDFTLCSGAAGFNIYENDNWLPMGFDYEYGMDDEIYEGLENTQKVRMLVKAIYFDKEALERNSDILTAMTVDDLINFDDAAYKEEISRKKESACKTFEIDRYGFTATTSGERQRMVFFSVPYDKGWSATVNGKDVLIEKASTGFMAVRVPEGDAEIRFDYMAPGLINGIFITAAGAVLLLIYVLLPTGRRKKPAFNSPRDIKLIADYKLDTDSRTDNFEDIIFHEDAFLPEAEKENDTGR